MPQSLTLAVAVVALLVWGLLAFVVRPGSGTIHLLLALGVTLLIRWIALRPTPGTEDRRSA